jgi:hypothetical protein
LTKGSIVKQEKMSQNIFRYAILYQLLDFPREESTSDGFPTFDDDWDMKTWTTVIFVYYAQKFFKPIWLSEKWKIDPVAVFCERK